MYITMINMEQEKAEEIGINTARAALTQDKIFRFWATSHGGLYVPVTKKTPPNPALAHLPHRDLNVADKNLTLMDPAYALRQMMNEYEGLYGLKGHITSLKLLNPNNAPDTWEKSVLEGFENGIKIEEKHIYTEKGTVPVLRVFEPLITKKGCLKCHDFQGYKVGDVRGGVSVTLPMTEIYDKKEQNIMKLMSLHALVWLYGVLFISYFYRKTLQSNTEQQQLNEELVKKEHFLRTLIDTDSNLIITNFQRNIHLANQAALDFTGYATLEAFKKEHNCICDLFEEKENCLQEQMGELYWIEYVLATPEQRHHVCMKKGKREHIFNIVVKQMDMEGEEQYIVVFNDISELLHSQENLALAQHIANVGHWELDLQNNELHWSDEVYRIFGVDKAEFDLSYKAFIEMIHPDDRTMVDEAYQDSLESQEEYRVIHRIIHPDTHEEKIVEERCEHYHDSEGKVIRSLGTIQDITERKRLEEQLHEKEEMMLAQSRHAAMGEMISMIAHQWRQPITVIAMGANNLLADVELEDVQPESVRQSAALMLEQTHHLSKTIDDFKNFFRPNKKTEMTLVNDVLEENFSIVGKSLENHNIAVEKEYNSVTPIPIFSRELLQVFINILKNAKEALIEKEIKEPLISVATREDEEHVYISICDNGKGIDPAILAKIYDPYFSTKDEKIGTGLGLYMSKTIVEKHLKGIIKAENREEGGICFEISLPKKGVSDNE
ncbi:MAG: DUF3365 domain-containing protein [Campylobacterota bacterium]|nr:DUF3365 domain-containing protein [Campylobacterota bacterium]